MKSSNIDFQYILPTPVGKLGLTVKEQKIAHLSYVDHRCEPNLPETGFAFTVFQQLDEYFSGRRKIFDLPVSPVGTDYQQKVWRRLQQINYGQSLTYGELAAELGSGARAVGNACRWNPVLIVVPCHRVVSKKDIGGYAGKVAGEKIERKILLLEMEGALCGTRT